MADYTFAGTFPASPTTGETMDMNGVTYVFGSNGAWAVETPVTSIKLDGIEANATADQTKADIEALGIAASSITGALPAIDGSSLTNVQSPLVAGTDYLAPTGDGSSLTGINGLPSGGDVDQVLTNTGSGTGTWQDAAGGGVTVKSLTEGDSDYVFTATSDTIMFSGTSGAGGGGGHRGQDRTTAGGGGGTGCVVVPMSVPVTNGTSYTVSLGSHGLKGNNYHGSANNDTNGGAGNATILKETVSGTNLLNLGGGNGGIRAHGGGAGGSGGTVSGTYSGLIIAGAGGNSSNGRTTTNGGNHSIGSGYSSGGNCPYSSNANSTSSNPGSGLLFATVVH